jgi:hypothetical protein
MYMKFLLLIILCSFQFVVFAQNVVPSREIQIKTALLAAPADKKDSAAVYGYSESKEFIQLRKGLNELICTADDPSQAGFSVACYHKDLEPFMQRGRDLRKEGKAGQQIFDARENEVKAGTLKMPAMPTTLFVYNASDSNFNRNSGEIKNGYLRYVVYIPYATAENTGLPLKPSVPGMPWIMHPGTHGAHIMINPARQ